ncbi:unnamed protein product [Orchesella dallaii]|uniref:Uncharacterized protein n=1 Tax=Orchesella dallaii TaxID=48710 RepID=A0ABP1RMA6_9HEXA
MTLIQIARSERYTLLRDFQTIPSTVISEKTRKLYKHLVKLASFLGAIPFKWSKNDGKLTSPPSSRLKFLMFCGFIVFYVVFLIINITHELFKPKPDLESLPLAFGTLMITLCMLTMARNMAEHLDEMRDYINSYNQYAKEFEGKTRQTK